MTPSASGGGRLRPRGGTRPKQAVPHWRYFASRRIGSSGFSDDLNAADAAAVIPIDVPVRLTVSPLVVRRVRAAPTKDQPQRSKKNGKNRENDDDAHRASPSPGDRQHPPLYIVGQGPTSQPSAQALCRVQLRRSSPPRRIVGLPAFAQPLRRGGASGSVPPPGPSTGGADLRGRGGEKCEPLIAYHVVPPPRWGDRSVSGILDRFCREARAIANDGYVRPFVVAGDRRRGRLADVARRLSRETAQGRRWSRSGRRAPVSRAARPGRRRCRSRQ